MVCAYLFLQHNTPTKVEKKCLSRGFSLSHSDVSEHLVSYTLFDGVGVKN